MAEERIIVGRFGAPHGVRGEIRIASFTQDPMAIARYRSLALGDGRLVRILALRTQGSHLVARIDGVAGRDAAHALTNLDITIERSELPPPEDEDEFYHADLIGLSARGADGTPFGRVIAVHDFGAGDILEIKPEGAASFLHPFTRAATPNVDLAQGHVVIVPQQETSDREDEA